jgi:hypothetical protein
MKVRRAALVAAAVALAALAALFALREDIAAWWIGYRFVWAPPGATSSVCTPNAAGEVVVSMGDPDSLLSDGVWAVGSGQVTPIPPSRGTEGLAQAVTINDKGCVVGALRLLDAPEINRPFVWRREGGMELIQAPSEVDIHFDDINGREQAVGSLKPRRIVRLPPIESRAFLWTLREGFRELPGLSQESTEDSANGINEPGWIAGGSIGSDGRRHPVLWMPPEYRPRDLGLPPSFDGGSAVDLNDRGGVLVNLWGETEGGEGGELTWRVAAFIWTEDGGLVELPIPEGYSFVIGSAVSEDDTVLLEATRRSGDNSESRSFLARGGTLRELPGPVGAREVEYRAMSDRGWLVGTALTGDGTDSGCRRGFVAQPLR